MITAKQIGRLIELSEKGTITEGDLDTFLNEKEGLSTDPRLMRPEPDMRVLDMLAIDMFRLQGEEGNLASRVKNWLAGGNRHDRPLYVGELVKFSSPRLTREKNLGKKSVKMVEEMLHKHDLYLGMRIPHWTPPS